MKSYKAYITISGILLVISVFAVTMLLNSCKNKSTTANGFEPTTDSIADGKKLVQIHCTKCHSLVPVNALTKDVWTVHTLPAMARYFAISTYGTDYYKSDNEQGGLSLVEWQRIVSYYRNMAPDTLQAAKPVTPLINDWAGFTLKQAPRVSDVSFTTMAVANPNNGKIYTGDVVSGNLTEWDSNLKMGRSTKLPSAAMHATFSKDSSGADQALISCIGRLDPIDFLNGRLVKVKLTGAKAQQATDVATELPRPVQTLYADFDKDGKQDLVVCAPGHLKGGVYILKPTNDGKSSHITSISDKAGAMQAVAQDFNNDGWQDIMVLFGFGDESLTLFTNDHKGGFTSKDLLRFPPVYGSTSFQLTDFDHDGKLDIIYTCGYNFLDSRILKPYHGLYIYKNTGNFNLKQSWFYPINGCTKAIATDFDKDGDIDIATIAFFADMKNKPAEEFIYFEQDKTMQFKPHAIPVSQYGRWMSLDVNDINKDGRPDIILGNYASGFLFQPNFDPQWDEHIPFIVLQNNTIK
jgi:hypothetical protein